MKGIKDVPSFQRPREKLVRQGPEALTDAELLAVLLGSGIKGKNVLQVAQALLRSFDRDHGEPDIRKLIAVEGIGLAKACQLMAALEFARRRFFKSSVVVRKAQDVLPFVSHVATKKQEHFLCVSLNGANEVMGSRVVTIGLLNSSQIHPREVFADVIADRAAAVILVHNHPSGVLDPSPDDIAVTNRMLAAGKILGIAVLDHIIVTRNGYFSFQEKGLI